MSKEEYIKSEKLKKAVCEGCGETFEDTDRMFCSECGHVLVEPENTISNRLKDVEK